MKSSEQPWQCTRPAGAPGRCRTISHSEKSVTSCEGGTPAAAAAACRGTRGGEGQGHSRRVRGVAGERWDQCRGCRRCGYCSEAAAHRSSPGLPAPQPAPPQPPPPAGPPRLARVLQRPEQTVLLRLQRVALRLHLRRGRGVRRGCGLGRRGLALLRRHLARQLQHQRGAGPQERRALRAVAGRERAALVGSRSDARSKRPHTASTHCAARLRQSPTLNAPAPCT